MSERDWQKIYLTAFGKMDSDQDGEAEAAFRQVRQIHVRQGIGFRHVLDRVQNAADPIEIDNLKNRVREVEGVNVKLGRQNIDLTRENARLRVENDKYSLRRRLLGLARTAMREVFGAGKEVNTSEVLCNHWPTFLATTTCSFVYTLDHVLQDVPQFTLAGLFAFSSAFYLVGTVVSGIDWINQSIERAQGEDKISKARAKTARRIAAFGISMLASIHILNYDNENVTDAPINAMITAGDLGPRIFKQNYQIKNQTRITAVEGKTFQLNIPQMTDAAGKGYSKTVTCTIYWRYDEDVMRNQAANTNFTPDLSGTPYRTFGDCATYKSLTGLNVNLGS